MKKLKKLRLNEFSEMKKEEMKAIIGGYDPNVLYRAVAVHYERQEFRTCEAYSYETIRAWADCWIILGWSVQITRIDLGGSTYSTNPYIYV